MRKKIKWFLQNFIRYQVFQNDRYLEIIVEFVPIHIEFESMICERIKWFKRKTFQIFFSVSLKYLFCFRLSFMAEREN